MTIHRTGPVLIQHFDVHLTSSVPTATIDQGALCAYVSNKVVAAPSWTWDTDLATTQAAFVAAFLGISEGRSRIGEALDLRLPVNLDGVYEFDCTAAAYTVGQYVGPAKAAGDALTNNVVGVASASLAVARVLVPAASGSTKVIAKLLNTVGLK